MDLSNATDEDEREWTLEELENVREVYDLTRRDLTAALDLLVTKAQSYGWAESLLANLEDVINVGRYYTAPWLREYKGLNTRTNASVSENDMSDDDLFGETSNIFMLVAPDSEILGQLPASAENHKRLLKRAREEAPNYIEAGYGIYDEMEIVLVNNGNFDGQKKIQVFTLSELMNIAESGEPNDDDLFGSEPALSGAKRLIYNAGRKILHSLEQAWQNPAIQREYKEYQEVGDTDAQFDQVVRIVKLPFKQVFVVDTIIREFAGAEGLNDFGWMIESGEFNDLVDAWQRFRDDPDIEHEDWFQRDARDFTGGLK